ncbi:MAG TPA: TetR/AcrR family transcriptional regulator [Clostridiaceae bacterium]|nr:TetR/AcrR family transcriptional regulator [Clostridiaceae bacterium]
MSKSEYYTKEAAIYNGVIELIKNGANPYLIKVSDIAKAANVGKGTIYDYFSTKEEAISKAILYSIKKDIENVFLRVKSKEKFKDKFYEILYIMAENMEDNKSTFNMLVATGGIQEFYEYLINEEYDFSELIIVLDSIIEHLIQAGTDERLVDVFESKYYKKAAIRESIRSFGDYISSKEKYKDISLQEAMDTSYRLAVKSLR